MTDITIEDIRKWKDELSKAGIKSRGITFNEPQGHISNGVYRIADGVFGNKDAWDAYCKALIKAGIKQLNNDLP